MQGRVRNAPSVAIGQRSAKRNAWCCYRDCVACRPMHMYSSRPDAHRRKHSSVSMLSTRLAIWLPPRWLPLHPIDSHQIGTCHRLVENGTASAHFGAVVKSRGTCTYHNAAHIAKCTVSSCCLKLRLNASRACLNKTENGSHSKGPLAVGYLTSKSMMSF